MMILDRDMQAHEIAEFAVMVALATSNDENIRRIFQAQKEQEQLISHAKAVVQALTGKVPSDVRASEVNLRGFITKTIFTPDEAMAFFTNISAAKMDESYEMPSAIGAQTKQKAAVFKEKIMQEIRKVLGMENPGHSVIQ